MIDGAFEDDVVGDENVTPTLSLEQLNEDMMTLSLVPKSQWKTLLHLDLIKERNKPKEAPKLPEKAPFFLPALDKAQPIGVTEQDTRDSIAERSRIMKMNRLASEGAFTVALRAGGESGDCMIYQASSCPTNANQR